MSNAGPTHTAEIRCLFAAHALQPSEYDTQTGTCIQDEVDECIGIFKGFVANVQEAFTTKQLDAHDTQVSVIDLVVPMLLV